jgi:hypothetical protein
MRLITHLDPSQLRLGYLNCLVLVAGRHLDTRQGLVDRLSRFVFQPVTAGDRRWPRFTEGVDEAELEAMKPPVDERTAALHELFRVAPDPVASYPLHALWLAQRCVAPHLGLLAAKNAERIIDMARAYDFLTTGYALSEKGVFLQQLLGELFPGARDGEPSANPFAISVRPILRLFYLYSLLCVDALTPFLLKEFADEPGGDPSNSPRLIAKAAERLVETVERRSDIGSVEDLRGGRQLADRVARRGVAKNQAQPRYFHLFELGLLERGASGKGRVPYLPTEAGRRAAEVLAPLREGAEDQQEQLDRHFFRWAAQIYQMPARGCGSDERRLLYFTRGYPYLEREIGFTPGRTVALAGCLLGLEDGWLIEVAEMFSLLQRAAAGPWRPSLEYSGGSRLDQEFLIKIKPSLLPALRAEVERGGAEPRPQSAVQGREPS